MADNKMNTPVKDYQDEERIATFLRGEMTAEEETAFKDELAKDEELRSKAVAMARLVKATNEVGREHDRHVKDALLTVSKEQIAELTEREGRLAVRISVSVRRMLAVAAGLLALIAGGFNYYDYRHVTGLAYEYATTFTTEQDAACRGEETGQDKEVSDELRQLFVNVAQGKDIDQTTRRLSFLWQVATMSHYNAYTDHAPLIGWNLAIAYMKSNDKDKARKVLAQLAGGKYSEAMRNKAKELLEKL